MRSATRPGREDLGGPPTRGAGRAWIAFFYVVLFLAAPADAQELSSATFRITAHTTNDSGSTVDATNATADSATFRLLHSTGVASSSDRAVTSAGFQTTLGYVPTLWGLGSVRNEWMGTTDAGVETTDLWSNPFNWAYGVPTAAHAVRVGPARAASDRLTVAGNSLSTTVLSGGNLALEGGSSLNLQSGNTLTVDAGGTFRTNGTTAANRATVTRIGAGRYDAVIDGTLNIQFLNWMFLTATGLQIRAGATVPTFDAIRFTDGAAGGAYVNLTAANAATTLPGTASFVEFHAGPANNVNGDATAPFHNTVTFVNWAGSLGGTAFETNDPSNAVQWGAEGVPALVAPADGALVNVAAVPLDWSDAAAAFNVADYEVQVDNEATFTPPLSWTGTVAPSNATTAALADGQYWWRVRWRNASGNSGWSAVRTFTVDTVAPTVPALVAPADAAVLGTTTPTLDWADSTDLNGVANYDVEADADAAFTPPLEWNATVVPSTAVAAALAQGQHFWHVRARDNAGNVSAWSVPRNFIVDTVAPTDPALNTPANGAILGTTTPTLDWADSTDANGVLNYDVEVDADAAFTPPLEWSSTIAPSTATTAALAQGQHFWRVRARDNATPANVSGWSVVRNFIVDTVAPTDPTLNTPANGAILGTTTPTLDWADSADANGVLNYDVEVDADAAFTPPLE